VIEARQVKKRYGSFVALDGVSFGVEKGAVCGFLGLNGAGKTTFIRLLSCFLPPTAGSLRVAGFDTVRQSQEVRRRIGYLPERVPLYDDMRVREYLRFRGRLKGLRGRDLAPAVERVISRCGLEPKATSPIGTLSKGYRQRVGVADAMVQDPELLILDEPTSGLDPDQRREVRHLIQELRDDRTVFLSTHILPEAEATCSQVIILHQGMIRASDRLDVLRQSHLRYRVRHRGAPLPSYGEGVESVEEEGPVTTVIAPDQEVGSGIVAAAVEAGRPVLEMRAETPDLEAIFMRITTGRSES
jgi:ABC-2 type transport system ATP-binding protein